MHSKQWHYSLHRDFQNCYSTRRSPTGFFKLQLQFQLQLQLQFYKGTRTPSIHIHLHVHIQRILHSEIQFYIQKTELFEYYYYTTDSRNSTHRTRRSSRNAFVCLTRPSSDIPGSPAASPYKGNSSYSSYSSYSSCSRDIPDIPVIYDLPAFPGNPTMFQYLQGIHPIPAFSD